MNTLYLLLKFVHVVAVVIWIGGTVALMVINSQLARAGDATGAAALARQSAFYGEAVIGPAMGVTLLAGIGMVLIGLSFTMFWIIWGLVGILISGFLGAVPIRRAGELLAGVASSAGPDDPRLDVLRRNLSALNMVNLLLLLSVIWAMIFKPTF